MIEKIKYPDGSFYTKITEFKPEITFRLNSYEDLWQLAQIKDVYDYNNKELSVIIPNLLDAQADRRFSYNEPSSLKMVCKFINNLKFKSVSVFHPHNAEVVEALIDNVIILDNNRFIHSVINDKLEWRNLVVNRMRKDFECILMSSDAGGFKPLMKLCDKIKWKGDTYSASKSRSFDGEHSKLIQLVDRQDFEGKDILIVDDICVKGGTFKGLSKLLKERNCGKLYLAISHITIQDLGEDPVTNYFDKVFTTNSKFEYYYHILEGSDRTVRPKNLEVIDLFEK